MSKKVAPKTNQPTISITQSGGGQQNVMLGAPPANKFLNYFTYQSVTPGDGKDRATVFNDCTLLRSMNKKHPAGSFVKGISLVVEFMGWDEKDEGPIFDESSSY
jgi:hypothetical protein